MAEMIAIVGESGSGKTTSIRNLKVKDQELRVLRKSIPISRSIRKVK